MATLPRHIQQQVDAAEALIAQATAPAQIETPSAAEPPQLVPPQQEPPAPVVAETPPSPPAEPQETWEQRYRSLQGVFNKQVPTLQQQTKELSAQLQQAQAALEKLQAQAQAQAPAQEQKPSLDPKDVDAFGTDLVEMVQRVTQSVLGSMATRFDQTVQAFDARLVKVERSLESTTATVARTAEETFFDRLTAAVPDWESVNSSQSFLDWLGEVDPVYGQPRQAALDAAQGSLNPDRAIAVFNAFKATLPKPVVPPKADPLSKQVAPRSSAAAAPVATEKPILTQQQISAFYADVARGRYRGREAEQQQTEQTINLAIAEDRVR